MKTEEKHDRARWWMEYRLNGRRIHKAISEARTKAQAERAEVSEREAIYNRRYNQATDIAFRVYYDEHYLPWLKEKKPSQVVDAESRVKKLNEFFGNRMLSDITRRDVERFQSSKHHERLRARARRSIATFTFCQQFFPEQYAMKLLTLILAVDLNRNQRPGENAISRLMSK
jgi:hypothetical protein